MKPASAPPLPNIARRDSLKAVAAACAGLLLWRPASASAASISFGQWIEAFKAKAIAHGVAPEIYTRVMSAVEPDRTGLDAIRNQPEFTVQLWQYLNRATSDWKVAAGRQKAKQYAPLFARIEKDFGVETSFMLGVWGIESAFGDPVVAKNHMRPVIPSLATLAWAEPRRRAYWERELINALLIVQNGWSTPAQMIGSWAGAMGHTQWMPEVWLHVGFDYDNDGKISPYGPPDDALASTARYFVERGGYRRGEHWGYEVRATEKAHGARSYAEWQKRGVTRADGGAFPQPEAKARLWVPVPGGPAFLIGPNFLAAKSYNPSTTYALALCYLGDLCVGGSPLVQKFPGSEPNSTLAEIEEIQRRLTALGFDTGGADGRVGLRTTLAVHDYQRRAGIEPADGYAGVKLLARLRQGS
ncbi:MAG: lytic murein transglycosylase [Hyphomicrobiales bacterium]|nr:lytic murein transglycosylase [Hyphomicrobiales bacterium]